MADVKKVIEIEVDTDTGSITKTLKELNKNIEMLADAMFEVSSSTTSVKDELQETNKELKKSSKEAKKLKDETQNVEKNTKKSTSKTKRLAGAWKKVGTAIKAAGIGLLVAGLAKITEVLSRNQGVLDGFSTAMNAISITVNQAATAISNAYSAAAQATNGFDALGRYMSGLLDLVIKPFEFAWVGIQKAILLTQKNWEESIFGDNDPEVLKNLKSELSAVDAKIVKLGEEAKQSAFDMYNNFGEAWEEVTRFATESVDELSKISIEANIEQAKYITDLGKSAELAEVRQQGLIEKFDRQAEIQRQIRDDFNLGFDERIAANEKLGRILEQQANEEKKLIDIRKEALQANFDAGIVAQQQYLVEYETLKNEEAEIDARIEGFRSEQLINEISLRKEQTEFIRQEDALRIELLKEQTELIRKEDALRIELMEDGIDKELMASAAKYDELYLQAEGNKELQLAITEAQEREAAMIQEKYRQKEIDADKAKADAKKQLAMESAALATDLLVEFASFTDGESKRGFQIQKAASLAQATTSTALAAIEAFKTASASPITIGFPAYPFTQAAAAAAFGAVRIAKIASTQYKGGGGSPASGGGSRSGGGESPNVQFNTVGGSGINQLNESIVAQNNPVKAYVVSSEVSSAQSLDRNRQSNATFG